VRVDERIGALRAKLAKHQGIPEVDAFEDAAAGSPPE